ncbi:MAG: polyprenol monophosphomannose synthase [Rhodoluna sp.]|jgi:dolichol-phosphate mannosyltransferase|nr:polyprenol monophosphomannose synthase [Rhodoluna sp.]
MPTYNESGNIDNAVIKLFADNSNVDLLIVDDSSPDGTGNLADAIAKKDKRVHVLHRLGKDGLGAAYIAGFNWAFERNYDYLVEMDADGSHRAQDLPLLLAAAVENDLVIGSRYVRGGKTQNWPLHRQILSRGGNRYARLMLGGKLNDMTAGFRVFRTSFLKSLDLTTINARGYSFQIEMAYRTIRAGGRTTEVPITFVEREIGDSKMSSDIVREALLLMTKLGVKRLFGRG